MEQPHDPVCGEATPILTHPPEKSLDIFIAPTEKAKNVEKKVKGKQFTKIYLNALKI